MGKATRDLSNRAHGMIAEMEALLHHEALTDRVLVARVRSKLGRVVSHPRAIQVTVWQGRVTLRGPILAGEVAHLLSAVASVRGVTGVDNHLDVHDRAGGISALQGGVPAPTNARGTSRRTGRRRRNSSWARPAPCWRSRWRGGGLTGLAVGALGVGLVACNRRVFLAGGPKLGRWTRSGGRPSGDEAFRRLRQRAPG